MSKNGNEGTRMLGTNTGVCKTVQNAQQTAAKIRARNGNANACARQHSHAYEIPNCARQVCADCVRKTISDRDQDMMKKPKRSERSDTQTPVRR